MSGCSVHMLLFLYGIGIFEVELELVCCDWCGIRIDDVIEPVSVNSNCLVCKCNMFTFL